jgi:hypothetical protein
LERPRLPEEMYFLMDPLILESLAGGTLFYPCSGPDLLVPIEVFAPYIQQFWFADRQYFVGNRPRRPVPPVLEGKQAYQLLGQPEIWRAPSVQREAWSEERQRKFPWRVPWVQSERYRCLESGKELIIHRRSGYAAAALRHQIESMSVFFYRGDSYGERGSGTFWLQGYSKKRPLLEEVLQKLVPGGLLVTDGSNCPRSRNPYVELTRFHWDQTIGEDAVTHAQSFADKQGRHFTCVGYVGERYGPTLAWHVSPPSNTTYQHTLDLRPPSTVHRHPSKEPPHENHR